MQRPVYIACFRSCACEAWGGEPAVPKPQSPGRLCDCLQAQRKAHVGYRVFAGIVFFLIAAFYVVLWVFYSMYGCATPLLGISIL